MQLWSSDEDLFALVRRELFTAVVGDVMDTLSLRHQFLPPAIKPLRTDMVVLGRAMPVLAADMVADIRDSVTPVLAQPYGLLFRALDDLQPREVYLCTGASPRYALWGELMSTRALKLGAAGAVLDGYARDTRYPAPELPHLCLRGLRPGPGAAGPGNRLPRAHRAWRCAHCAGRYRLR